MKLHNWAETRLHRPSHELRWRERVREEGWREKNQEQGEMLLKLDRKIVNKKKYNLRFHYFISLLLETVYFLQFFNVSVFPDVAVITLSAQEPRRGSLRLYRRGGSGWWSNLNLCVFSPSDTHLQCSTSAPEILIQRQTQGEYKTSRNLEEWKLVRGILDICVSHTHTHSWMADCCSRLGQI